MKKIITAFLTVAAVIGSMCTSFADTNSQPANSLTIPVWKLNQPTRVTRVYNESRQSWEAKLVNSGNTGWSYFIQYDVPAEMLVAGHTYEISAYLRTESKDNTWVALDWAGHTTTTPYVPNMNNGGVTVLKGLNLPGNSKAAFGFTGKGDNAVVYVDDLKIKDETTGEYLDLPNAGFEESIVCSAVENAEYADGKITWTLPDDMTGNGVNIYKCDIEGNRELLNEIPVSASDMSYKVEVDGNTSYKFEIYTCQGEVESHAYSTIEVTGKYDFGTAKIYKGDNRLLAVETGEITVNIPFVNRSVEEGVNLTVIAQLVQGTTVTNIETADFTVMPGEEFEECTLSIDVDEVKDGTRLEVCVWDGLEEMNILYDMIMF